MKILILISVMFLSSCAFWNSATDLDKWRWVPLEEQGERTFTG